MKGQSTKQDLTIDRRSQLALTNAALKELNQRYAHKISKGEIDLSRAEQRSHPSADTVYDQLMKNKKISQAEREKQELEKKLEYLNRSIQSIRSYDYATATANPADHDPPDRRPLDLQQLRRKQLEMKKKFKQQRRRSEQRKQQQKERQSKSAQQQLQKREKDMGQARAKRQQQILENMQKIKSRMDNRQEEGKKQKEEYRKMTEQKTLFKKLEEGFQQRENAVLEERKKKLADIRNLHRPISIHEIQDHQRRFKDIIKEKEALRERERRFSNLSESYRVSYKSPTHLRYSQTKEQEQSDSRIKTDKMRQFSLHVKEHFVPEIDERKRQSIEKVIEEQEERKRKAQNKKQEERERVEFIRNKGLRYLEEIRELPKKKEDASRLQGPKTERPQYKNYITHSQNSSSRNWAHILAGKASKQEKAIKLHYESQKLENSLRMKQQKTRLLKGDCDQIDREYFEMIRAKLDLLQT